MPLMHALPAPCTSVSPSVSGADTTPGSLQRGVQGESIRGSYTCRGRGRERGGGQPVIGAAPARQDPVAGLCQVPVLGRHPAPLAARLLPAAQAHGLGGHRLLAGQVD